EIGPHKLIEGIVFSLENNRFLEKDIIFDYDKFTEIYDYVIDNDIPYKIYYDEFLNLLSYNELTFQNMIKFLHYTNKNSDIQNIINNYLEYMNPDNEQNINNVRFLIEFCYN